MDSDNQRLQDRESFIRHTGKLLCLCPEISYVWTWHAMYFCGILALNHNKNISTNTMPVATKRCRMVTCFDGLLPIKSHDRFITCFCEITWQTKTIISPLPTTLPMTTKLGRVVTYLERLQTIKSHMTVLSRDLARSRDKRKPLYLPYQSAYGHQTWQNCNFPWRATTFKVTWPFNLEVLRDHMTN